MSGNIDPLTGLPIISSTFTGAPSPVVVQITDSLQSYFEAISEGRIEAQQAVYQQMVEDPEKLKEFFTALQNALDIIAAHSSAIQNAFDEWPTAYNEQQQVISAISTYNGHVSTLQADVTHLKSAIAVWNGVQGDSPTSSAYLLAEASFISAKNQYNNDVPPVINAYNGAIPPDYNSQMANTIPAINQGLAAVKQPLIPTQSPAPISNLDGLPDPNNLGGPPVPDPYPTTVTPLATISQPIPPPQQNPNGTPVTGAQAVSAIAQSIILSVASATDDVNIQAAVIQFLSGTNPWIDLPLSNTFVQPIPQAFMATTQQGGAPSTNLTGTALGIDSQSLTQALGQELYDQVIQDTDISTRLGVAASSLTLSLLVKAAKDSILNISGGVTLQPVGSLQNQYVGALLSADSLDQILGYIYSGNLKNTVAALVGTDQEASALSPEDQANLVQALTSTIALSLISVSLQRLGVALQLPNFVSQFLSSIGINVPSAPPTFTDQVETPENIVLLKESLLAQLEANNPSAPIDQLTQEANAVINSVLTAGNFTTAEELQTQIATQLQQYDPALSPAAAGSIAQGSVTSVQPLIASTTSNNFFGSSGDFTTYVQNLVTSAPSITEAPPSLDVNSLGDINAALSDPLFRAALSRLIGNAPIPVNDSATTFGTRFEAALTASGVTDQATISAAKTAVINSIEDQAATTGTSFAAAEFNGIVGYLFGVNVFTDRASSIPAVSPVSGESAPESPAPPTGSDFLSNVLQSGTINSAQLGQAFASALASNPVTQGDFLFSFVQAGLAQGLSFNVVTQVAQALAAEFPSQPPPQPSQQDLQKDVTQRLGGIGEEVLNKLVLELISPQGPVYNLLEQQFEQVAQTGLGGSIIDAYGTSLTALSHQGGSLGRFNNYLNSVDLFHGNVPAAVLANPGLMSTLSVSGHLEGQLPPSNYQSTGAYRE